MFALVVELAQYPRRARGSIQIEVDMAGSRQVQCRIDGVSRGLRRYGILFKNLGKTQLCKAAGACALFRLSAGREGNEQGAALGLQYVANRVVAGLRYRKTGS